MGVPVSIVITVTRNDAALLPKLIESMAKQTLRPNKWIIVDDSSDDETQKLVLDAAENNDWITYVQAQTISRKIPRGERISTLFLQGINENGIDWDYCSKIDSDMILKKEYFEQIFSKFSEQPRLGIASGNCLIKRGSKTRVELVSNDHTRGGLKTYKRQCYEEISGITPVDGWDTIDNLKAQMKGWETRNFPEILVRHSRPTGYNNGMIKTAYEEGKKAHFLGYSTLYLFARSFHKMFNSPPFVIGGFAMMIGYLVRFLSNGHRFEDKEAIRFLKRKQISRLTFGLVSKNDNKH